MVNLAFSILIIVMGLSMIIFPKKYTERPSSKIKSEMGIRIFGIILVVLAIVVLVCS